MGYCDHGTWTANGLCAECDAIRADERARIVAWLRKYAEPEDDGTWHINDAAGQIERGEYLELRHDPARKPPE